MFGRKQASTPSPKMSKDHEKIRKEVIDSRDKLLAEIAKLNKKFDIAHPRKKP